MDNLKDPSNRINAEASTSSNEPPSSSKKRKNDEHQNEFEAMKQQFDNQKDIIYSQICELHEERSLLKNVKDELERMKKDEAELQSKIVEFEAQKKAAEAELIKLKADMNDQLVGLKQSTCEMHEKRIKELEAELQSKTNTEISLRAEMTQMKQNNDDQAKLLFIDNYINDHRLKEAVEDHEKKANEMVKMLEAKQNIVAELQFELEEMKKCYKADFKKNEEDKKTLKDEHDKKMVNMKIENDRLKLIIEERDKVANEMKGILHVKESTVSELQFELEEMRKCYKADIRKPSQDQEAAAQYQNKIKELNDKIAVVINLNKELRTKNEELKQKELNTCADIVYREKQIQDLHNMLAERAQVAERIVDLDELCDDTGFRYDRLLGQNNITVIKVEKLEFNYKEMNLYSGNRHINLNLLDIIKNVCQFQINGEWDFNNLNSFNELKPIIHSFNLMKLNLCGFTIDYQDFTKLVSSHTITTFIGGSIKRENGEMLTIDEILKELPNIEICEIGKCDVSKEDCKKLAELSTFSNLRQFTLKLTKSPSDLLCFAEFIKKHQNAEFIFGFPLYSYGVENILEKIQKLREILPSNCKVT